MIDTSKWEDYFYGTAQLACGAVSVKYKGMAQFIGSAVYIAPGLFITAKHVVEDPLSKVGITKQIHENKMYGQLDGNFKTNEFIIEVVQMLKIEARIAQRWNINKFSYSHDLDLAILTADFTDGPISKLVGSLPNVSINIHPYPKINRVVSYGFYGNSVDNDDGTATTHTLSFQGRVGKILDFHQDIASIAGMAVYELDNKIEHMMSGGAVCNDDGAVIAINSSSIEPEEVNGRNRTICTPIIRAMYLKFDYKINGNYINTSLYELAQTGYIEVIGIEHLSLAEESIIWSPNKDCKYCYPD